MSRFHGWRVLFLELRRRLYSVVGNEITCYADDAASRVNNDLAQMPVAMLKRWKDEMRVRGPTTG